MRLIFLCLTVTLISISSYSQQHYYPVTIENRYIEGEYQLDSIEFVRRGRYNLWLSNKHNALFVPEYYSNTWKRKTKFHRYFSVTMTKKGAIIKRI